jgi:hypothetical protein
LVFLCLLSATSPPSTGISFSNCFEMYSQ